MKRTTIAALFCGLIALILMGFWFQRQKAPHTRIADRGKSIEKIPRIETPRTQPGTPVGERKPDSTFDGFELPFVGEISMPSCVEKIEVQIGNVKQACDFRVFRDSSGRFVRAEYKDTSIDRDSGNIKDVERAMKGGGESIEGLAKGSPKIELKDLVKTIAANEPFDQITGMTITFVRYKPFHEPPEPARDVFIINVRGLDFFGYGQLGDKFRRVRFLAESNGSRILSDTTL